MNSTSLVDIGTETELMKEGKKIIDMSTYVLNRVIAQRGSAAAKSWQEL